MQRVFGAPPWCHLGLGASLSCCFFLFFPFYFPPSYSTELTQGKLAEKKKLNPHLFRDKPCGPSCPQPAPAGEVPSSLPRWVPPSSPAEEHRPWGGGWRAAARTPCARQVAGLPGLLLQSPPSSHGAGGSPAAGMAGGWDTPGTSLSGESLPVTLNHDPRHGVFQ